MEYCVYYLLIYVISTIFIKVSEKKGNTIRWISIIGVIILWSVYTVFWPYNYACDRYNYAKWFTDVYPTYAVDISKVFSQKITEPGWMLFNVCLTQHIKSITMMFFIYAFMSLGACVIYIDKIYKFSWKSNMCFGASLLPLYSTYLCRQMFSMVFVLPALYYWKKEKKIKAVIFLLLGSMIHSSSLIIVFYFLSSLFIKDRKKLFAAFLGIFPMLYFSPRLGSFFMEFFHVSKWSILPTYIFQNSIIKCFPFLFLFIIFLNAFSNSSRVLKLHEKILSILFCVFSFLLSGYSYWIYRLYIFFLPDVFALCSEENEYNCSKQLRYAILIFVVISLVITLREIYMLTTYFA